MRQSARTATDACGDRPVPLLRDAGRSTQLAYTIDGLRLTDTTGPRSMTPESVKLNIALNIVAGPGSACNVWS